MDWGSEFGAETSTVWGLIAETNRLTPYILSPVFSVKNCLIAETPQNTPFLGFTITVNVQVNWLLISPTPQIMQQRPLGL